MRALIVIPTYREYVNLKSLIPAILNRLGDADILVIDDGSNDGTIELMREFSSKESRVHFILRERREGLGKAYVEAFAWAIQKNYEVIVQMDADHSHRVQDLELMLGEVGHCDFVVGSRRILGGQTRNWSHLRRLLSWSGNRYAQYFLGPQISDWTGGFNIWRRSVLAAVDLNNLKSHGYSFQIELKYRALRLNFRPIEVPIIFEERREGHSKMSLRIIAEAFAQVWRLGSEVSQS